MKQNDFAGPEDLRRLEQELSNAWDTIEGWKTSHERVVAEAAMQNTNKEAQIQDLLEAVHQRDMRLRHQDADIIEKTRQIAQLTIDDRHLTKLKAHQEARKQLKVRISLRDENQKQKDEISRLTDENQQQKDNIATLQGQLSVAEESVRETHAILVNENQQQKDKIASLNRHLKLTIESAYQDGIRLREEDQQQKDTISSLQGQLALATESARQAHTVLVDENQKQKDKIASLNGQLKLTIESAHQDRVSLSEENAQQMAKIFDLRESLAVAKGSLQGAHNRQKNLSEQHQETTNALVELKAEFAQRGRKLERSMNTTARVEAELAKVKEMGQKGCSLARDVRYWDKNRRAERYSQAGKYEQDAVRAAKEFDCGCSTCEKRR